MDLRLITAIEEDLTYIVSIYNSVIPGGEVTADTVPVSKEDWLPWFRKHNKPSRPVFLLIENDTVCGWMSFSTFKDRPAYDITVEVSIYLDGKYRGRGLGKRFLSIGLDEISKHGVLNVIGLIFSENIPSMQLFEKLGFESWGTLPKVCVMKGREKSVSILGKRLVPGGKNFVNPSDE